MPETAPVRFPNFLLLPMTTKSSPGNPKAEKNRDRIPMTLIEEGRSFDTFLIFFQIQRFSLAELPRFCYNNANIRLAPQNYSFFVRFYGAGRY